MSCAYVWIFVVHCSLFCEQSRKQIACGKLASQLENIVHRTNANTEEDNSAPVVCNIL